MTDFLRFTAHGARMEPRAASLALASLASLAFLLLAAAVSPVRAQQVDPALWITDGPVTDLARIGGVLYVGGQFGAIGPYTGGGVPLGSSTGTPLAGFPVVRGAVRAVEPDGSGGWFVAGGFDSIGGLPRKNLAHILSDFSVAPLDPAPDGEIFALALGGGTLYLGGSFGHVAGQARNRAAAIDATTGALKAWNPSVGGGSVQGLLVNGATVYLSGNFLAVGGTFGRHGLAAVDATSGAVNPTWDPNPTGGGAGSARPMVLDGPVLYVGGDFTSIGGQSRSRIAALDAATGLATSWNPGAAGVVDALALADSTLYVGGIFSTLGGQPRARIGAVRTTTGTATAWNPSANTGNVGTLEVSGSTVYAGGSFTSIGLQNRYGLAALDAGTGTATSWNPNPRGSTLAIAATGATVYAGGDFRIVGAIERAFLAALDLTTGQGTSWNPNPNGSVEAVETDGSRLFVGGSFTFLGGQLRNRIASFDGASGALESWNPGAGSTVFTLLADGGRVYAGGTFATIGGASRARIAALDAVTGLAIAGWDPGAGNAVLALAPGPGVVYAGGTFTTLGGQARSLLGALDAASGAITAWNPGASGSARPPEAPLPAVNDLAVDGSTVYAGGDFVQLGGQPRGYLGAVDAATGFATPWNPNADWIVHDVELNGGASIYAGGEFLTIGGQPRLRLALIDRFTGAPAAWRADVAGTVASLVRDGSRLLVGGSFESVGGVPAHRVAAISSAAVLAVGDPPAAEDGIALRTSVPHPVRDRARIAFTLPAAAAVKLELLDTAGRRVRTLAESAMLQAGEHEIAIRRGALAPGVYFVKLRAGARSAESRLVIAP